MKLRERLHASQSEVHGLREEVAITGKLLDEALAAAAAAVAGKQAQRSQSKAASPSLRFPSQAPTIPPRGRALRAGAGAARAEVGGSMENQRPASGRVPTVNARQAAMAVAAEQARVRQQLVADRVARRARESAAVLVLQAHARGMVTRNRLWLQQAQMWAALRVQSTVRGNAGRAIADRRRLLCEHEAQHGHW